MFLKNKNHPMITLPSYYNKRYYNSVLKYWLVLFVSLIILKSCGSGIDLTTSARMNNTSERKTNVQYLPASYLDTPMKTYVFVIKLTPEQWQRSVDTLSLVIEAIGKSKNVDEADVFKQAAYRQLNRIAQRIQLDSIVSKPKK